MKAGNRWIATAKASFNSAGQAGIDGVRVLGLDRFGIKRLITLKATAFVMAHNHPSGNVSPSQDDKSITVKLGIAAASIDVQFHDHIIVGDGYHSMADTGWLKKVTRQFTNLLKTEPTMKGDES